MFAARGIALPASLDLEHLEEDNLLHEIEAVLGVAPDVARAIHDEEAARRSA